MHDHGFLQSVEALTLHNHHSHVSYRIWKKKILAEEWRGNTEWLMNIEAYLPTDGLDVPTIFHPVPCMVAICAPNKHRMIQVIDPDNPHQSTRFYRGKRLALHFSTKTQTPILMQRNVMVSQKCILVQR